MRSHVCARLADTQQGSIGVFWFSAVWYAPEGKRGLERPGLKLAKSDAMMLSGRNPFNTEWAEASCGEMLEHRARAQPSQVVAVVPTDFDCNAWKDLNDMSRGRGCVFHCFLARRRTAEVHLNSDEEHPEFRNGGHEALQNLDDQVSERRPPPCCWCCYWLSNTKTWWSKITRLLHRGHHGFRGREVRRRPAPVVRTLPKLRARRQCGRGRSIPSFEVDSWKVFCHPWTSA